MLSDFAHSISRLSSPIRQVHRRRAFSIWLLSATAFLLWAANQYYPIRDWLFPVYLRIWLFSLCFCGASLVLGWRVLAWIIPVSPRSFERLLLAFATGVLCFYLGTFLGGVAHLYGRTFFFALPLVMFLIGAPRALRDFARYFSHLRRFGVRIVLPRGGIELGALTLLVLSVVAVYLPTVTPQNLYFDATWYHIPIAEDYVAYGGIRRFDEGWYLGAYPQLSSLIYAWAFMGPSTFFDRLVLCTHLEFCLFLVTLLGVSVLAERLLRERYAVRTPYAAAVRFLFPSIFVCDTGLGGAAEHVLAFWAAPIAISLIRLSKKYSVREACLSGLMLAGAVCTKVQGVYLFVPGALLVCGLIVRNRKFRPALVWALACMAVSSTYWLKNWIFYHDPLYPFLHAYLPSRPLRAGAHALIAANYPPPGVGPQGHGLLAKVGHGLLASLTGSVLRDGQSVSAFPGQYCSTFGWLYAALTVPLVILLRTPRRLWVLVLGVETSFVLWYLTGHLDRYLQALMPLIAAATAAALVIAWKSGSSTRIPAILLVVVQLVWESDSYFVPYHAMAGDAPIRFVSAHFGSAYRKKYAERFQYAETNRKLFQHLPLDARALLHRSAGKLGLGVQTVTDSPEWQGELEYMDLDTPARVAASWRKLGVTNVIWQPGRDGGGLEDIAREVVFVRALQQYARNKSIVEDWAIAGLSEEPLDPGVSTSSTYLAWLACEPDLKLGIYAARDLNFRQPVSEIVAADLARSSLAALSQANAVVVQRDCSRAEFWTGALSAEFTQTAHLGKLDIWLRERRSGDTAPR